MEKNLKGNIMLGDTLQQDVTPIHYTLVTLLFSLVTTQLCQQYYTYIRLFDDRTSHHIYKTQDTSSSWMTCICMHVLSPAQQSRLRDAPAVWKK